jgi:hypothetical protein
MTRALDALPFDSAWKLDDNRDDDSLLSLPNFVEEEHSVSMDTDESTPQNVRSTFEPFPWMSGFPVWTHKDELAHSANGITVSDEISEVTSSVAQTKFSSIRMPATARRLSLDDRSIYSSYNEQKYQHQKLNDINRSKSSSENQANFRQSTNNSSYTVIQSSGFSDDANSVGDDITSLRHCYYFASRQQQQQRSPPASHDSIRRMISCMQHTEETRARIFAQLQLLPMDSGIRTQTNIENFSKTRESSEQLLAFHSDLYNRRS